MELPIQGSLIHAQNYASMDAAILPSVYADWSGTAFRIPCFHAEFPASAEWKVAKNTASRGIPGIPVGDVAKNAALVSHLSRFSSTLKEKKKDSLRFLRKRHQYSLRNTLLRFCARFDTLHINIFSQRPKVCRRRGSVGRVLGP